MTRKEIKARVAELQQQANQIATQVLNTHPQYQNIAGRIQELNLYLQPDQVEEPEAEAEEA